MKKLLPYINQLCLVAGDIFLLLPHQLDDNNISSNRDHRLKLTHNPTMVNPLGSIGTKISGKLITLWILFQKECF